MGGIVPALRRKMGQSDSETGQKKYRVAPTRRTAPARSEPEEPTSPHESWRRPLSKEERKKKIRNDKLKEMAREREKERERSRERKLAPPKQPKPPPRPPPVANPHAVADNDNRTREAIEDNDKRTLESIEDKGNMASVVEDLWQTLMTDQAQHLKAIGGDLFSMGAKKQRVQQTQRQLAHAEKACDLAHEKMMDKKGELKELATRLIQAGPGEMMDRTWHTGELCFRKGQLCTIERVHYDEDPAYFEVQPVYSPRTVVGTEAGVLLVPAPFQQGSLRQKLREVDATHDAFKETERKLTQARKNLQEAHEDVVTAHELAEIGRQAEEPEILPAPIDFTGAPPGMPDMSLVQKWTGPLRDIPETDVCGFTGNLDSTAGGDEYEEFTTDEGEVYFCSVATGDTTWALPPGARLISSDEQEAAQEPAQGEFGSTFVTGFGETYVDLSQQAQQQEEEREAWNKWYQEYTEWYQANLSEEEVRQFEHGQQPQFQQQQQQQQQPRFPQASMPPADPPKPQIQPPSVSSFRDRATHALVVAIQREMATMLENKTPLAERRRALRELHRQWHPDKNPDKKEVAKSVFQFVEESKAWFLEDAE